MRTDRAAPLEVLFGKARRQILGLLLPHPHKAIFLREIVRLTGLSPGATQRELTALVKAGVLTRAADGRLVYFQANIESPLLAPLQQLFGRPVEGKSARSRPASVSRTTALRPAAPAARPAVEDPSPASVAPRLASEASHHAPPGAPLTEIGVPPAAASRVEPLRAALARLQPRIAGAFIYGPTDGTDVNLMVVGRASFAEVANALAAVRATVAGQISPMVYPAEEFRRKLAAGNAFLTSVLDQPRAWVLGDGRAIGVS